MHSSSPIKCHEGTRHTHIVPNKCGKIITFIMSNKHILKQMLSLQPSHKDAFCSIKLALKGWRPTVNNETQGRWIQKYLNESNSLLTLEDLLQLKSSKPYTGSLKTLIQAKQGKELGLNKFTLAQDLLLVKFSLTRIILVTKHERSKEGPAMLGMEPELQDLV